MLSLCAFDTEVWAHGVVASGAFKMAEESAHDATLSDPDRLAAVLAFAKFRLIWERGEALGNAPPKHLWRLQDHGEPVPQSGYKWGTGRSPSANEKGGIVTFCLEDGAYLRVSMALAKDYTGLVFHNDTALAYFGQTVTVRFEVNKTLPCNTLILIGCAVAGVPIQRLPGELVVMVPPGERLRSGKLAEDHRLA